MERLDLERRIERMRQKGMPEFEIAETALRLNRQYGNLDRDMVLAMVQSSGPLGKEAYIQYLKSPRWKSLRLKVLDYADNRCQLCSTPGKPKAPLEVHHNTYERLGHELMSDLIALCGPCHRKHHGK